MQRVHALRFAVAFLVLSVIICLLWLAFSRKTGNLGMGYTLVGFIPEGYHRAERIETEYRVSETYVSERNQVIIFTALTADFVGDTSVFSDEGKKKEYAWMGKVKADLYLSTEGDELNAIVWREADGRLFSIQGFLTKEQLVDMAVRMRESIWQ